MDLTCFNWVQLIKKSSLPGNAKYLALYLSTFMNAEQNMAWPSISRICDETGMSRHTIIKYTSLLEDNKWLIVNRNGRQISTPGGIQANNEYLVNVPAKVVQEMHYLIAKVVQMDDQGSANGPPKVVHPVHSNNNINNNINNNCEFDRFWTAYPKKVAKPAATKAFKKIKPQELDGILSDIAKRKTNGWQDPQFIPYPSTYLNQRRWEDEDSLPVQDSYGLGAI